MKNCSSGPRPYQSWKWERLKPLPSLQSKQLSEMQAQILNSMRGEDVSGRASDKW